MGYVTLDNLQDALGPSTFLAIFDDKNLGTVAPDSSAVKVVLRRAHAEVASYLPRIYDENIPAQYPEPVADLLFAAELDFAMSFAFERHPEYVRFYGEDKRSSRFARAQQRMDRIAEGIQQVPADDPAVPEEPTHGVLRGGVITDNARRVIVDNPDGTPNSGDF